MTNRRMSKYRMTAFRIIALACVFMTAGCKAPLARKQQAGAAVAVNGHYLYRSTLDSLTTGLKSEDSLRVAQLYISQWAKDMLEYDEANSFQISDLRFQSSEKKKDIEKMVEDYRRMLYIQAYEEWLTDRRMPKTVSDATAREVYEQMPDRFRLDESIVKGLLLVVPQESGKGLASTPANAKNQKPSHGSDSYNRLKKELSKLREESKKPNAESSHPIDRIEKYAYQNATGYELFMDRWVTVTTLTGQIPIERAELEAQLKNRDQIEVSDSLKTYILQVTDKCLRGEQMPMEYARPEIEQIVLGARQVEFLKKERERLYNEAIQEGKVVFYSN